MSITAVKGEMGMAKINASRFASDAVKLWHTLGALDALKAKLKERGLTACTTCVASKRDRALISKYFRARNAASAILNALAVQVEH